MVGGVLPQASVTPNADAIYRAYGAFWYRVIMRLALDDVFHSGWFLSLSALFALNLVLCMSRRARRSLGRVFGRPHHAVVSEDETGTLCIPLKQVERDPVTVIGQLLRRRGYTAIDHVASPEGRTSGFQIVAQRWRWSTLAPDMVHAGILIILAGALLGILRQEGTFVVNEWEKSLRLPACETDASTNCIPLKYDLRVDDFGIETYEGSSRVKTYWAELSFLRDANLVRQGRVSVNHPLTIGGFAFYAWRYGNDVQAAIVRLHVMEREQNAVTAELELQIGDTIAVPGTQLRLTAVRFYRTFALTDDGQPTDLGNVPSGHSAVLLQITGVDETGTIVAYRDVALPFVPLGDVVLPHTFLLADAFVPAFLEIHYARNPGYPIVWWGFALAMGGLAGAFYFTPLQIRVAIHPDRILLRAEGRSATRRSAKHLEKIAAAIRLHCCNEEES